MNTDLEETQKRISKAISGYKAALMNNTKWREVLLCIAKQEMQVQFAFVRDEVFLTPVSFAEGGIKLDYVSDCTIHGPFYFKDIFAIKCQKYEQKRNSATGRVINDDTKFIQLQNAFKSLGELPIKVTEDGLTIHGYEK